MAQISRFQYLKSAKNKIKKYFEKSDNKIFTADIFSEIFDKKKEEWNLANVTTLKNFIEFLIENKIVKEVSEINLPKDKKTIRYLTGDCLDYEIGYSLYKKAYFSHYTAMYLQSLTNNIPKVVYLNSEQIDKGYKNSGLTQEGINRAFANKMRATNQIALYKESKIYMLNGKFTNNLGVEEITINNKNFRVTGIERTLIDIVVRPDYAGGVIEIIEAYKRAKEKCSVNILIEMLTKLDYTYPYHQSIAFYMEKAGYKETVLKRMANLPIEFDFYLCYKIEEKDYSEKWRLFFPKGI